MHSQAAGRKHLWQNAACRMHSVHKDSWRAGVIPAWTHRVCHAAVACTVQHWRAACAATYRSHLAMRLST